MASLFDPSGIRVAFNTTPWNRTPLMTPEPRTDVNKPKAIQFRSVVSDGVVLALSILLVRTKDVI